MKIREEQLARRTAQSAQHPEPVDPADDTPKGRRWLRMLGVGRESHDES
ncbi:MAG: hypothetical protein KY476_18290 [Planctomycetes bacterium]|nr:hypothetical protein [Planctomycetota bacterium]